MLKYHATAVALKAFSTTAFTRSAYRKIGNLVGEKRRGSGQLPGFYLERLERTLRMHRQHPFVRDGVRVLELGTGWLHWDALCLRLFYDTRSSLFDVWDNRQLEGVRNYVRQLSDALPDPRFELTRASVDRAQGLIREIVKVGSFEELYSLLDFNYHIDADGSLRFYNPEAFDLVISGGVLEHVRKESLPSFLAQTHQLTCPGGWALHSIDTSDHLSHYDQAESKKRYIIYSEATWRRYFENDLQYINRLQRQEWFQLFSAAGFSVVREDSRQVDIASLKPAGRYASMDHSDLDKTVLRLLFRKEAAAT